MATVKKYNLAGVSTSLELGKQGSYISGNSSAIGFYTSGDALQKIAIANATVATQAIAFHCDDPSVTEQPHLFTNAWSDAYLIFY